MAKTELTTRELAKRLRTRPDNVTRWAAKLGLPKRGRDYLLTEKDCSAIAASLQNGPGNPNFQKKQRRAKSKAV
jgi:hypothetical protein